MSWFNDAMGFTPVKTQQVDTSEYSRIGKEYLDPQSIRNRGMYNSLKQMGVDSVAQQYLGNARMQAMGQNPFANQQQQAGLKNVIGQTQAGFNTYMNNAANIGSGLMGQAMQGDLANAAAVNQARMVGAQNKSGFYGGLLAAATQALPFAMFGFPGENPVTSQYNFAPSKSVDWAYPVA